MNSLMSKVLDFGRHRVRRQVTPVAEPEVLLDKPLPMVGLFGLLTDEQKKLALNFEEDERFGSDEFRKNRA